MGNFPVCCSPVGSNSSAITHTIQNVGGGVESYIIGTGPNPFDLRTFESSDASVGISQGVDTIDLTVDAADLVSLRNVGGFSEVWVDTTGPDPFDLRTLQSSDGTVGIQENTNDIDLTVVEAFQEDSSVQFSTNSATFVTMTTLPGDAKVMNGDIWKINMGVLICCPYATAGTGINAETLWLIETSAGVFTEVDRYSVDEHIIIVGLEKSSPRERNERITVTMNAPRMRIQVRRTVAGATLFFWEEPRWGGVRITPAP